MGLDGVGLVIAVEEEFGIVIEDADAERIRTPRDLIDHVERKVGCVEQKYCSTQRAFHQLRQGLMRHGGLERAQIRPELPMIRLLPFKNRQKIIRNLLGEIGIASGPEMVRPRWLVVMVTTLAVATAAALAAKVSDSGSELGMFFGTFTIAAILLAGMAAYVTRPLRCRLKPALASVGSFSRWLVAMKPETFGGPTCEWTRPQIAEKVRKICIEQLGLSAGMYREDADFVEDFGVG